MAIAGRVAIVPKGEWSADATYKRVDAVTYNNALFIAKKEVSVGILPTNIEYWMKSIDGSQTIPNATKTQDGLMSKEDKTKIDDFKQYKPDGKTITADEDGTLHGAAKVTVDDALSPTSTNPVQYKVVKGAVDELNQGLGIESARIEELNQNLGVERARIDELNQNLGVERARIDSLTKLPEGSTTGDAELQDIRVKADGTTATSAGNAVREQVGELKSDLSELYNVSDKGNFYDVNKALVGHDIVSSTGKVIVDSRYTVSNKIYMDFTKPIWFKNSSYVYAYCYGDNDTYYGRVDIEKQDRYILHTYPSTKYIRLVSLVTDTNVMVMYWDYRSDTFVPYHPIEKWIESSKEVEAIKNMVVIPVKLRIASFNSGDFTGIGLTPNTLETAIIYRKAIADLNADVCAFQYDVGLMNQRSSWDYIIRKFFKDGYFNGNRTYDYFALESKYNLSNKSTTYYVAGTAYSHSYFQHCDLKINGKTIHFVNVHFEWKDNAQRATQIAEVITHVANYDTCIICGDFNPEDYINGVKQSTNLTYREDLQKFIDVGFKPCNANDDYLGVVNTIAEKGDFNGPWDNILVKGNITICNFGLLERPWMNDHFPIYIDVIVN